ncbi:hypothetical protein Hdeb2414_s0001g00041311 [Helianthus debilis subsp. tardiflorus]
MANKSVIVMTSSFTGEAFESIDADVDVSDSDSWQVVDPSDSDEENFSYGDVTTTGDDVGDEEVASDVDDLVRQPYGSPSSDISMQSLVDEISYHYQEVRDAYEIENSRHNQEVKNACEIDDSHRTVDDDAVVKDGGLIYGEDDPYEEDDDVDDDDEDLDDELVPKWLNNKFERQRMRKLGKRAYPKMKKSKRLANQYNKPGCVHGKHGLGMKHNLVW